MPASASPIAVEIGVGAPFGGKGRRLHFEDAAQLEQAAEGIGALQRLVVDGQHRRVVGYR